MADSPASPDTADDTEVEPDRGATTGASRWQKVVGIIGLVVAVWVGSEMYDVVVGDFGGGPGAGGHGPGGGETPTENQERETDTDDGGHDPSQFDHG